MKEHIQYDFLFDNHFNELKEKELQMQRIHLATQMDVFVGKYFSIEYIRKHILEQSEKEFKEIDKQMQREIDRGLAMDPIDVTQMDQMDRMNTAYAPEIQSQQADDQAAINQAAADDAFEKQLKMAKSQPTPTSNTK